MSTFVVEQKSVYLWSTETKIGCRWLNGWEDAFSSLSLFFYAHRDTLFGQCGCAHHYYNAKHMQIFRVNQCHVLDENCLQVARCFGRCLLISFFLVMFLTHKTSPLDVIGVCVCVYVCTCACVCACMCLCACMYACMCVHMYVCICGVCVCWRGGEGGRVYKCEIQSTCKSQRQKQANLHQVERSKSWQLKSMVHSPQS